MSFERRIQLYTDEDVHSRLASQLKSRGFDAVSCRDAGNAGRSLPDDWQLRFATEHGRVILTHDVGDYVRLANDWETRGERHAGIILARRVSIGELLIRVERHLLAHSADHHYNLVLHLSPLT